MAVRDGPGRRRPAREHAPKKKPVAKPKAAAAAKKRPPRQPPPPPLPPPPPPLPHILNLPEEALEGCVFFLPDVELVCAVKAVCRAFCGAARRVLRNAQWLAMHLPIHDLLDFTWANERQCLAAVSWRAANFPEECVHNLGGPQRLPAAHCLATRRDCSVELMRALLEHAHGAATKRTRGRLPLHTAALHCSEHAIRELLRAFPAGLCVRDSDGCLPLHLAAAGAAACDAGADENGDGGSSGRDSGSCSSQALRALLAANPECAMEPDVSGMLPIHHAAVHRAPVAAVRLLLRAFPDGAEHVADFGWTPLTLALVYGADADVAVAMLEARPQSACMRSDAFGCLPLHFAAKHGASPRVIRALLTAHPTAAYDADGEGRLPLHVLAAAKPSEGALSALLQANPLAAAAEDLDGYLPLHHAALSEPPAPIVLALLRAFPASAARLVRGALPLHMAVSHHAPAEAVRHLIAFYPPSAHQRNADGDLPIHIAAATGASAATFAALLDANPSGARQRTRLGRLPLQLVARRGIVGTDAEDVTTRRSTSGSAAAALGAPPHSPRSAPSPMAMAASSCGGGLATGFIPGADGSAGGGGSLGSNHLDVAGRALGTTISQATLPALQVSSSSSSWHMPAAARAAAESTWRAEQIVTGSHNRSSTSSTASASAGAARPAGRGPACI